MPQHAVLILSTVSCISFVLGVLGGFIAYDLYSDYLSVKWRKAMTAKGETIPEAAPTVAETLKADVEEVEHKTATVLKAAEADIRTAADEVKKAL